MKKLILLAALVSQTACSTLGESYQLGATMGGVAGAAAAYAAHSRDGEKPELENLAAGAAIGVALGLITSHFTHKKVEEDRQTYKMDQMEVHFGDLPPSPFIMPKFKPTKGSR